MRFSLQVYFQFIHGIGFDPFYSFYAPLTALIWKRRQRIEPIVFLVQDVPDTLKWQSHPITQHILKYLCLWGIQYYFLDIDSTYPKNNERVSQGSRLYAASLCDIWGTNGDHDNSFLLTTDVDIWPIMNSSFYLNDPKKFGKITNAFCCRQFDFEDSKNITEHPISTIGLTLETWRKLMNLNCSCKVSHPSSCLTSITNRMNTDMKNTFGYGTSKPYQDPWSYDQIYISYKLHQIPDIYQNIELIRRKTTNDRIDRSSWKDKNWDETLFKGYIDSHVLRPGYTKDNWQKLEKLLKPLLMLDGDEFLWNDIQKYVVEFRRLAEKYTN